MSVYRIAARSAPLILCPKNAIEPNFWHRSLFDKAELIFTDNIIAEPEFQHTWSKPTDELAECCEHLLGMPFESLQSLWVGRLGELDDCWHLIKVDVKNGRTA